MGGRGPERRTYFSALELQERSDVAGFFAYEMLLGVLAVDGGQLTSIDNSYKCWRVPLLPLQQQ